MLWGIGGVIALLVAWFGGFQIILAPLALFCGIAGIIKKRDSALSWISAIGGLISFLMFVIYKYDGEVTVTQFFVRLWDVLSVVGLCLLGFGFALILALGPFFLEKPLAQTPLGAIFQLILLVCFSWLIICFIWIDYRDRPMPTASRVFLVFFILADIACISNFIHYLTTVFGGKPKS